jgi:hypothetical protein
MANEITVTQQIQVTNDNFVFPKLGQTATRITQNAQGGGGPGYVIIGFAAEEDIAIPDVTTLGWCWMKNLSDENYVDYGPKSAGAMVPFGRLKPGEIALLRLVPGITIRAQANTANVKTQIHVFED